jgi:hypothetical protein
MTRAPLAMKRHAELARCRAISKLWAAIDALDGAISHFPVEKREVIRSLETAQQKLDGLKQEEAK